MVPMPTALATVYTTVSDMFPNFKNELGKSEFWAILLSLFLQQLDH